MATRRALSTFRLATINVHGFESASTFKNNVDDLVKILQPLDIDLLAVEEVYNGPCWEKFCEKLSFKHYIFDATYGKHHGNGLISRYPIEYHSSQRQTFSCAGGTRSLLQCRLTGDHPFIKDRTFAVTHLDHLNEDDRLRQIKEFKPHKHNIDVLLGDMNALTRDDYSDNYFRESVLGKRDKSGWEKPRFDLTSYITHEWDYQDALKMKHPEWKDAQIASCPYGTRIDYIYVHPRVFDQWTLKDCSIIHTQPATDHHAILATFEQKSE